MSGAELVITFLGTGSAVPANDRQQSSFALRHQNGLVIFDCGEGTQYALRKLGISTRKEVVIWISHLHSDHFLGLPGLLASFQLLGRSEEILIVGPIGLAQTVQNLIISNYVRTEYEIKVIELKPDEQFRGTGYSMKAIKANHEANALSVRWEEDKVPGKVDIKKLEEYGIPQGPLIGKLQQGEIIEYQGKTIHPEEVIGENRRGRCIVYTGDTAYNEDLVPELKQCDLLVHEATYPSDMIALARERKHTTVRQAVSIAQKGNVPKVVLTHLSPRINNIHQERNIAKSVHENVEFAYQGMIVKIPYLYHND